MVKRSNPDQFQLRLPPGLRERIKAYADRHGRSMNAEIVRVLENEYPEPWSVGGRVEQLLDLLAILKGGVTNEDISRFVEEVSATVEGVVTGRISGLTEEQTKSMTQLFSEWSERTAEEGWFFEKELDSEELDVYNVTGKTEKFVFLDEVVKNVHPQAKLDDGEG